MPLRRRLPPLLAALLALALVPSVAHASRGQESLFQDDNALIYSSPSSVAQTLDTLKSLGVDRVRVSVFWHLVAPDPDSRTRPANFDPRDPAQYPSGAWDRYDTLVRLAQARGIGIDFNVTSPAPLWATGTPPSDRPDLAETWQPSPIEFRYFMDALGTRYSGGYTPPGATAPLPRVSYWSIWNEPDQGAWLSPQWGPVDSTKKDSPFVPRSPESYRDLVDAGYAALAETGHAHDTILVGELAPNGSGAPKGPNDRPASRPLSPLLFLRELYCVDRRFRPYRGTGAAVRGCPPDPADFVRDHPGLFRMTGIAEHPYTLLQRPQQHAAHHDDIELADVGRLERTLRSIMRRYHQQRTRIPLYLTEYGYQTDPPDPTQLWSWRQQAKFLNEAEYMTSRRGYVRTLSQFLLRDDAPGSDPHISKWSTFQSGLETLQGKKKDAYYAYRMPIWLPRRHVRRGHRLRVWGMLRAAPNGIDQRARIQLRRHRHKRWHTVERVTVRNAHGYFERNVRLRHGGRVRIAWKPSAGAHALHSRSVRVHVRRR